MKYCFMAPASRRCRSRSLRPLRSTTSTTTVASGAQAGDPMPPAPRLRYWQDQLRYAVWSASGSRPGMARRSTRRVKSAPEGERHLTFQRAQKVAFGPATIRVRSGCLTLRNQSRGGLCRRSTCGYGDRALGVCQSSYRLQKSRE